MCQYVVHEQRKDEYGSSTSSLYNIVFACNDIDIANQVCKDYARRAYGRAYYWVECYVLRTLAIGG